MNIDRNQQCFRRAENALRLLALTNVEKAAYLSTAEKSQVYLKSEELIKNPVECALHASLYALRIAGYEYPEHVRTLISEIRCVGQMAIILSERAGYFWELVKNEWSACGVIDDAWLVLQRLAKEALVQLDSEISFPKQTFTQFIEDCGFTVSAA